ncbi:uncharacterized protein PHACADRAFT_200325 [Phanerochaete carnosa HHB-10118-sp]|uniref:Uncharacterized protein n=1 Tax=Phanerochaete carnosa (strain HHB-10118-sp) TaxID=650164 RepID=K5VUC3_PHACS|nr:uncharacterized protein PHACADRAFT_200325 [Phanerochaete carnosa HHB-10118-sp]EKM50375.1 hypothetical protein PHACADRAFT_200325 [Phanerochaete carnosa HHB-10118-sp]
MDSPERRSPSTSPLGPRDPATGQPRAQLLRPSASATPCGPHPRTLPLLARCASTAQGESLPRAAGREATPTQHHRRAQKRVVGDPRRERTTLLPEAAALHTPSPYALMLRECRDVHASQVSVVALASDAEAPLLASGATSSGTVQCARARTQPRCVPLGHAC